jgi:hypothetical protein
LPVIAISLLLPITTFLSPTLLYFATLLPTALPFFFFFSDNKTKATFHMMAARITAVAIAFTAAIAVTSSGIQASTSDSCRTP